MSIGSFPGVPLIRWEADRAGLIPRFFLPHGFRRAPTTSLSSRFPSLGSFTLLTYR